MEGCIADLAKKYEIAITGTIVHGTITSLSSIPDANPFVEKSDEATKKWSEYFQQIQSEMTNTDHLTLLNEAFFYDSTGKRRGTYVKKNLWHPERYVTLLRRDWTNGRDYLNPGQEHYPVFDTPWGKAGFLICTFPNKYKYHG
jgi:predicted amidohydrolase